MLLLLLAALVAAPPLALPKAPAAGSTKAFPFPTETRSLPNGLRIVFIPYDSPGLVAYYTLMRVGSRNEIEKGRSGFAHFFEHMMFRGTKAHPAEDYNNTVTRLGLNTNAFTSEDMTVYHLYGPAKALPTIIEYEGDRFQNLFYDEPGFRTEAGAILGEYQKSASNPEQKLSEKMFETAYTSHTYAHTTIGYLKDIEAMPTGFDYSRDFFKRYYTPDNATIVVVGDFDRAATMANLEKAYGGWQGKVQESMVTPERRQTKARRAQVDWNTPTLPRLWIAWHAPSSAELKTAAVQNLLNAYLFGTTSPLYQSMVLGKQLVDSIEPSYNDHRDPYLFGVLLRVKDAKDLKTVETAVLKDVRALATGKVDAKRLESVRSNLKYTNIMGMETPDSVAVTLAVNMAQTGEVEFLNEEFAQLDQLKPMDLSAFAKKYLLNANRTTVTLLPGGKTAAPAKAGKGGAK